MTYTSLAALAAALIGLSGCIAYPLDYPEGGSPRAGHDRGRDHDHERDRRGDRDDDRDHRPDCDPRISDCARH